MLAGDNSILKRATEAKKQNDLASLKERADLAYLATITKTKDTVFTEKELQDKLDKEFTSNEVATLKKS